MKKCIPFLFAFVCLIICSCGGDDGVDDCASFNFSQEIQSELNAMTAAGNAWAMDPTDSGKCNAYKDAVNDYLDAARDLEDCAREVGQLTQYNQGLDGAQAAINSLAC